MYDHSFTQTYENGDGASPHEISGAFRDDAAERLLRSFTKFTRALEAQLTSMLKALEASKATDTL